MTQPNELPEEREGSFSNLIKISKDLHIVTDGPLSQLFQATLQKIYAKETDPETGIAIESQAIDAQINQTLWIANKLATGRDDIGMLYGVIHDQTNMEDVMRVSDALTDMNEQERANSAIVILEPPPLEPFHGTLYKGADALPEESSPMAVVPVHRTPDFPVQETVPVVAQEGQLVKVPDGKIDVKANSVPAPQNLVVMTNERDASTGKTFQNFHFSDVLARNTSALYSNDQDWATRVYRSNNLFAKSIEQIAARNQVKVFNSLDEYDAHVKQKLG